MLVDRVARDGPVGVLEVDPAYRIVTINDATRLLLGIRESIDGNYLLRLARFHPLAALRDAIDNAFRTGQSTRCDGFSVDDGADKAEREVRITCLPPADDALSRPTVALVVEDITGLRQRPRPAPDRAPASAPPAGASDRSGSPLGAAERPLAADAAPAVPGEETRPGSDGC
jgi:hypothetical protein